MSALLRASLAVLAFVVVPPVTTLQAQSEVEIAPRGGISLATGHLGHGVRLSDGNFLNLGRIAPAPVVGISARLAREGSPWAVRATVQRSRASSVDGRWDCVGGGDPVPACFTRILVEQDATATLSTAVLSVERSLPSEIEQLRPFASLGVGAKRYSFAWPGAGGLFTAGEDAIADIALQLGVGAEWTWRGVSVVAELEDYASRFGPDIEGGQEGLQRPGDPEQPTRFEGDRHVVHDFSVSLGASFRVF